MEYRLLVDQLALKKWIGRQAIDPTDAVLIAFIRNLSPHDPDIARRMHGDRFRISLSWVIEELPILGISNDRLSRRIHALAKAGILDILVVQAGLRRQLFAKMSDEYFREEKKARDRNRVKTPDIMPRPARTPTVKTPDDHKKDDQRGNTTAAPFGGAAGGFPEEEITPAQLDALIAEKLPWRRSQAKGRTH